VHEQHELTVLDSGVRVVTEHIDSVRSVALGFWIGSGSAAEGDGEEGLSHLIEHMLFRGTPRYGSLEIDQIFDGFGAELNAGTGKETTSVYARVLDRHVDEAFDVMADMIWRPNLAEDELVAERQIVLEEIAMYEDDPQDKVFDVLGSAVFGDHPLGRAILGRAEVVRGTPAADLHAFHHARYVPQNVVVAAAGAIDHAALVDLVRRTQSPGSDLAIEHSLGLVPELAPRIRFVEKDTEQYHVCLGAPGIARDDDRRFALRVLDNILGGTSSSRLFQEVREKRGLAYAVYSFSSMFAGTGQVGLYVGTRPDNVARALGVIADELERFRQAPASADELARSKENVKGRVLLALESTTARMNRLGSTVLAGMPVLSIDEIEARIDAVTLDDVAALASELFDPARLSAAGIGADEDAFRGAIAPALQVAA
jgi:predicted Zn-dependent peptidase